MVGGRQGAFVTDGVFVDHGEAGADRDRQALLRGLIVPVYDIAARLGLQADVGEHSKIVIVESETQTVGLIVDAVDEVRTMTSGQLEQPSCADRTLIQSIAKMDDDHLVVLLNPTSILSDLALAT